MASTTLSTNGMFVIDCEFEDIGGKILLESEVSEITMNAANGKATGVKLKSGERLEADAIVANADVGRTYLDLIPAAFRKKYTDKKVSYPHTTLSYHKFNLMVSRYYMLVWIFEEASGSHDIKNESIIGRGLYISKLIEVEAPVTSSI